MDSGYNPLRGDVRLVLPDQAPILLRPTFAALARVEAATQCGLPDLIGRARDRVLPGLTMGEALLVVEAVSPGAGVADMVCLGHAARTAVIAAATELVLNALLGPPPEDGRGNGGAAEATDGRSAASPR